MYIYLFIYLYFIFMLKNLYALFFLISHNDRFFNFQVNVLFKFVLLYLKISFSYECKRIIKNFENSRHDRRIPICT